MPMEIHTALKEAPLPQPRQGNFVAGLVHLSSQLLHVTLVWLRARGGWHENRCGVDFVVVSSDFRMLRSCLRISLGLTLGRLAVSELRS